MGIIFLFTYNVKRFGSLEGVSLVMRQFSAGEIHLSLLALFFTAQFSDGVGNGGGSGGIGSVYLLTFILGHAETVDYCESSVVGLLFSIIIVMTRMVSVFFFKQREWF